MVMLKRITHRGPEGLNVARLGNLAVGHAQLRFRDRSAPPQPAFTSDRRCALAFNGEIYNFSELWRELRRDGVIFKTRGDAEVLLHLFRQYGASFVDRLRGMFVICAYDRDRDSFVLARDPIGKKPLYYAWISGTLIFASELSSLMAYPGCPHEISKRGMQQYFLFNATGPECSLIEGVSKLPPGSILSVSHAQVSVRRYWTPRIDAGNCRDGNTEQRLDRLIRTAVRKRLESDSVPLGLLLSGGLDSSLVAAYAVSEYGPGLPSFGAGFDGKSYDETPFARLAAKHIGLKHAIAHLSDFDLADVFTERYQQLDEPVADPSLLAMIPLTAMARQHVKGALSGDGADDIFLGYSFFQATPILEALYRRLPSGVASWLGTLAERLPSSDRNMAPSLILRLLARGLSVPPEFRYSACTSAFLPQELPSIVLPEVLAASQHRHVYDEICEALAPQAYLNPLRRTQLGMMVGFLQSAILTKIDRGSMLNGFEVRCPFLDLDVVTFGLSLPDRELLGWRGTKLVLRRIAKRMLPAFLANRRKQGFRVPLARLLRGQLRNVAGDLLSPARIRHQGLFRAEPVTTLLKAHLKGEADHQKQLWSLLCLSMWLEKRHSGHGESGRIQPSLVLDEA